MQSSSRIIRSFTFTDSTYVIIVLVRILLLSTHAHGRTRMVLFLSVNQNLTPEGRPKSTLHACPPTWSLKHKTTLRESTKSIQIAAIF